MMPGTRTDCYVIAEAGVNHNGDPAIAHALIDIAADARADAVKFQTFDPAAVVTAGAPKLPYQVAGSGGSESQYAMLERLALPHAAFHEFAQHAAQKGITFLSTAFDEASADFVEQLGVPVYKVPSGEITNYALLTHIARKGKPILLSTGMADLDEVEQAMSVIAAAGDVPVTLLHCVTSYPANPADCNLLAIPAMAARFNCPVGWSDHTEGIDISMAAVALGATVIEKHFTTNRSLPGPDQHASLEPHELACLVAGIRRVSTALGSGVKKPVAAEQVAREQVRRSLFLRRSVAADHRLEADDLVALRPGTGVPASAMNEVVGRKLRTALPAGTQLSREHLA